MTRLDSIRSRPDSTQGKTACSPHYLLPRGALRTLALAGPNHPESRRPHSRTHAPIHTHRAYTYDDQTLHKTNLSTLSEPRTGREAGSVSTGSSCRSASLLRQGPLNFCMPRACVCACSLKRHCSEGGADYAQSVLSLSDRLVPGPQRGDSCSRPSNMLLPALPCSGLLTACATYQSCWLPSPCRSRSDAQRQLFAGGKGKACDWVCRPSENEGMKL